MWLILRVPCHPSRRDSSLAQDFTSAMPGVALFSGTLAPRARVSNGISMGKPRFPHVNSIARETAFSGASQTVLELDGLMPVLDQRYRHSLKKKRGRVLFSWLGAATNGYGGGGGGCGYDFWAKKKSSL